MRVFGNLRQEYARLAAYEERQRAADRQVASMTAEEAEQMGAMNKWFPWMPPGVAYSLARAGQTALGNPLIAQVAYQALAAQQNTAMGFDEVGTPVNEKQKKKKGLLGRITGYSGKDLLSDVGIGKRAQDYSVSDVFGRGNPVGRSLRDNPVTDEALEPGMRHVFTGENPLPRGLRAAARTASLAYDFPRQSVVGAYRAAPTDQELFGQDPRKTLIKWGANTGAQTELGQSTIDIKKHGSLDQGEGFFVGGRVKEQQHIAEQQFGYILYPDGTRRARTPGRDLAGLFFEPGTAAHTWTSGFVDAGVAVASDKPLAFASVARRADRAGLSISDAGRATARAAEQGRAPTTVEALWDVFGAIRAPNKRLTLDAAQVEWSLNSEFGTEILQRMADTTDIRTLDRFTGGRMKPGDLAQIADITDVNDMRALAYEKTVGGRMKLPSSPMGKYGFELNEKFISDGIRRVQQRLPQMGEKARDLADSRQSFDNLLREMDYIKIDEAEQSKLLKEMADIDNIVDLPDKGKQLMRAEVFGRFEKEAATRIAREHGMDAKGQKKLRELMRRNDERTSTETNWMVESTATGGKPKSFFSVHLQALMEDPTAQGLPADQWTDLARNLDQPGVPTPLDLNEHQSRFMAAPDWTEVRRQMSFAAKAYSHGLGSAIDTMHRINRFWKTSIIMRNALLVRVMGEQQAGMTLRGDVPTWVTHPLDTAATVVADAKVPERLRQAIGKGDVDVTGKLWAEQDRFVELLKTSRFYRKPSDKMKVGTFPIVSKNVERDREAFFVGMADELRTIRTGPFYQAAVGAMRQNYTLQQFKDWAWDSMEGERKVLANAHKADGGEALLTRAGSDYAMEDFFWKRVQDATGNGDAELLEAAYSGELRGAKFFKGDAVPNEELSEVLKDFNDVLPDHVRVPKEQKTNRVKGVFDFVQDRVLDELLGVLFTNRNRTLNGSPQFRRMYEARAVQRAGVLDPQYADEFADNLAKGGMKKADLRQAKYKANLPVANGLTIDELDDIAFAEAVDDFKFYWEDLVDKRQVIKSMELVAPFAHVWSESMLRWAKIMSDPLAATRVERVIIGARDPNLGHSLGVPDDIGAIPIGTERIEKEDFDDELLQLPDGTWAIEEKRRGVRSLYDTDPREQQKSIRRGLFYTDPNTKQEMVAFGLTGAMSGWVGPPFPMRGRASGLNIIGELQPGVGGVASLPMAALADKFLDDPKYDGIREFIWPRGVPDLSQGVADAVAKDFLPTWLKRLTDMDDPSQTIDILRYTASTGEFNVSGEGTSQEEITRQLNAAKVTSRWMTLIRAVGAFNLPTSPSFEALVQTKDGRKYPVYTLAADLQQMREDDPRNSTINFLEKYGDNAMYMLLGKTQAVTPGALPPTAEAEKWFRESGKKLRGEYRDTYGFFAPQGGDLDLIAWERLQEMGDREKVKPENFIGIANDIVAKSRYYAFRDTLSNPSEPKQAAILRQLREDLKKEYPGYNPDGLARGAPNKAEVPTMIDELIRAKDDPKLANHEAIPALREYLEARDVMRSIGPSKKKASENWWISSTADDGQAAFLRRTMWDEGERLAEENKAFAGIWEGVLRREIESQVIKDEGGE